MILKKIKTKVCPHCGSEAVSEEKLNINPGDNSFRENKKFDCGLSLSCMPNSDNIDVVKLCPNSKDYKEMASRRVDVLDKLFRFIEDIDVDSEFKCNIRTALNFELNIE